MLDYQSQTIRLDGFTTRIVCNTAGMRSVVSVVASIEALYYRSHYMTT